MPSPLTTARIRASQEASRACKPDGRILLIEHGRSTYAWLNRLLDDSAAQHKAKWGCEWNRNIDDIVAAAGLEVLDKQKWHFGTTYVYTAKPRTQPPA